MLAKGPAQRATWSPFGGPYVNAFDTLRTRGDGGAIRNLFKVWGQSPATGHPFPFTPLAIGNCSSVNGKPADGSNAFLMRFALSNDSGAYAVSLPLQGGRRPRRRCRSYCGRAAVTAQRRAPRGGSGH